MRGEDRIKREEGSEIIEKGLGDDNRGEGSGQYLKRVSRIIHTVHRKDHRTEKIEGNRERGQSVA